MPQFGELIAGFRRFTSGKGADWDALAEGQSPEVMIVACCDSRVDPAILFDLKPGQAFVLRNVANIVPPASKGHRWASVSSALQYAVETLGVRHVVVLGHDQCGGIDAALAGDIPIPAFIKDWISLVETPGGNTADIDRDTRRANLERENVRRGIENLETYDFIAERLRDGSLRLHGCYFDISRRQLDLLGPDGAFSPAT